ncbi:monocarboxylate transporter 12-like [Amphiura filiformis]|uniref:monocarboxylate transporter 12-like n=1 Tax=Amphiura filiformis TaxID=82378 RepID=UPI003B212336
MSAFIKKVCEPTLFKQPEFWGTLAAEFAFQYSWTGWMIYLVPYARSIGLSPYQATSLSSAGGFGSLIGTVAIIFLLKTSRNLITILTLLLLIAGCSLEVYPFSTSLHVLMTASFTFGLAENAGLVAILSMSKSLDGELSQAVSFLFLASALGRLSAGFFTGWIHDSTNSYDISFTVLGGVLLLAAIIFGALLMIQKNSQ